MTTVSCAVCGDVFEVADELLGDDADVGGKRNLVAYCDLHSPHLDVGEHEDEPCCPFCGKAYEDFSDMGCGHCDRRSPDWGTML
jgi:hypothetical protein